MRLRSLLTEALSEPLHVATVSIHSEDVVFVDTLFSILKRYFAAVRRPRRFKLETRVIGESRYIAAIGVHFVDVDAIFRVAHECDFSGGGPLWIFIAALTDINGSKSLPIICINVYLGDRTGAILFAHKHKFGTIRRP